ncbi:MAG: hypothetical protein ACKOCH_23610, partial [Bacteroidota bacterium]
MKNIILSCIVCSLSVVSMLSGQNTSVQNIDTRVEALLAKMSLDDKIGQLNQVVGDISTGTDVSKDDLLKQV